MNGLISGLKLAFTIMKKILLYFFAMLTFSACKDDPPINSEDLKSYKDTAFTNQFKRSTGWVAGDGALSIDLNNGKSLWLFGDSHIDDYDAATNTTWCLFQANNAGLSMNIANPSHQQTHVQTSPRTWLRHGGDNSYWFWPGTGYTHGDTTFAFLIRLHHTGGTGSWAFEGVDSLFVAKINPNNMNIYGISFLGKRDNIAFGNGNIQEGNYIYAYGIEKQGIGNDLKVARYPVNNVHAAWEYHSNNGWTTSPANAVGIHNEFTSSFHVFKHKNKYVLITTEFSVGCNQGKHIYSYTSSSPTGPFSNKQTIWKVDDTLNGNYPFFYLAYAHPEFDNGKDELLVTYCINGYPDCENTCVNNRTNPDYYRPKAIRVHYNKIDPSF